MRTMGLPDGSVRRTFATATVGHNVNNDSGSRGRRDANPLALPSWIADECSDEAAESLEVLRDAVARVADAFVEALDAELNNNNNNDNDNDGAINAVEGEGLRGSSSGNTSNNNSISNKSYYGEMLSSANHLEHFHYYAKPHAEAKSKAASFEYHTDAGFFLAFVPAMDCRTGALDAASFYLSGNGNDDDNGNSEAATKPEPAVFQEDEVVILMGTGAQYWLEEEHHDNFLAAPHALRLSPGARRSWYGKMHLLPSSTLLRGAEDDDDAKQVKTFGELPYRLDGKHGEGGAQAYVPTTLADGCAGSTDLHKEVLQHQHNNATPPLLQQLEQPQHKNSRRRIQHVNSPENCNNVTDFFCWYQCIDIPEAPDRTASYQREGYSLYCLDPATLANSGNSVSQATDPCENGYVHNSDCLGSWQKTAPGVVAYPLRNENEEAGESGTMEEFCYGGTSMYMDGFNWMGTTCVIYLFPTWVLSSSAKLVAACLGSILMGILLEYVLWKRRLVSQVPKGNVRLALSSLVYGVQLSLGYLVMLVIMTYSGPLFLSTVVGLMVGHAVFNAQDSFVRKREEGKKKMIAEGKKKTMISGTTSGVETAMAFEANTEKETEMSTSPSGGGGCGCGGDVNDDESGNEEEVEGDETSPTSSDDDKDAFLPEGATPCCQYTL